MLPPVFLRSAIRTNFASEAALSANACRPTASAPRRAALPHLCPYSIFSFAFFVSSYVPLVSRVCAARRCLFLHPAPVPPTASALISIFSFLFAFSCRAASIDLARLRCAPDALISIFGFCQPFPFQAAPLWLCACHIPFSRFSVFLRPVFPPVL